MVYQPENSVSSETPQLQNIGQIKDIVIRKDEKQGFGINIVGGVDKQYLPGHSGIFISRIRREGIEGIAEGDRILAVNGQKLNKMTHEDVTNLLKGLSGDCTFTIESNAERKIEMNNSKNCCNNTQLSLGNVAENVLIGIGFGILVALGFVGFKRLSHGGL
uniref:PDZ domain-containing protein n=1 Tax=Meloidogyne hapla TaxID=6305 RepID=A0A1I8BDJ9_MELHA